MTDIIYSVTIPCLTIAGVNAYILWNEHWEHWEHKPPLEERPQYPYQNIRTKNFFWGDGDKVSLGFPDTETITIRANVRFFVDLVVSCFPTLSEHKEHTEGKKIMPLENHAGTKIYSLTDIKLVGTPRSTTTRRTSNLVEKIDKED